MTPLPHSPEVEQCVLSVCMKDEGVTYRRAIEAGVTEQSFFDPFNVYAWRAFAKMPFPDAGLLAMEGEKIGGAGYAMQVDNKVSTTLHAGHLISQLLELQAKRAIIRSATELIEHANNGTSLEELTQQAQALIPPARQSAVDTDSYRVTLAAKPTEPTTRLFLAGKPIATPGNLVTLISKAKTGKTATIGGVVAAIIGAHFDRHDLDTFGFTAPHTNEAVVLIDTEQSPFDAYTCHQRAFARANQPTDVPWLCHYAMVGCNAAKLRLSLPLILAKAAKAHKAVFTVILDGVADYVASVNDEAECNEFISWLRSLAVEYNCPIICVIHSNEAQKSGDDGRGHLGKQLTRKAESNLLLKKVGEITQITSEKQRKAPITEEDAIAFKWSDEHQRHISCEVVPTSKKGGRPREFSLHTFTSFLPKTAESALTMAQLLRYAQDETDISESGFRKIINQAFKNGELARITKPGGFHYHLLF